MNKRQIKASLKQINERLGEYYVLAFISYEQGKKEKLHQYRTIINALTKTRNYLLDRLEELDEKDN